MPAGTRHSGCSRVQEKSIIVTVDYIVFDLEWNQSPYGKRGEIERFPFEIIEIGAVKLNEQREIRDTFRALIRPKVYRKLHHGTSAVIGLTEKDLSRGIPFPEAAESFFKWCGEDVMFCTWGTADLTELQRNLRYYGMSELLKGPVFFEDVQKLFAIAFETRKTRRALRYAVEYLEIPENGEFHFAKEDAVYTAEIFRRIPEEILKNVSIDCFESPRTRDDEVFIRFDYYEKFVSREFKTREELLENKEMTAVHCFVCGKNARRAVRWFSDGGGHHLAVGKCPEHGYVKSKIRIRENGGGMLYGVRTTKMISEEEALRIRKKKIFLKAKRQNKRKK